MMPIHDVQLLRFAEDERRRRTEEVRKLREARAARRNRHGRRERAPEPLDDLAIEPPCPA